MDDFGNAEGHANDMDFGDIDGMDAQAAATVATFIYLNTAGCIAELPVLGKMAGAATGFELRLSANEKFKLIHDGASTAESTTAIVQDAFHSIVCAYDDADGGAEVDFFLDGANDGVGLALAGDGTANADKFLIGKTERANGHGTKLGNVMYWQSVLTQANAATYHAGGSIPDYSNLIFWARCIADPNVDTIGPITATKHNVVSIVADASDNYFVGGGGFAFHVMEWLAPVIAAGSFGANLFYEDKEALWTYIQQLMGRHFPDLHYSQQAYEMFINQISAGRAVWLV
jgi:hypothetical protein